MAQIDAYMRMFFLSHEDIRFGLNSQDLGFCFFLIRACTYVSTSMACHGLLTDNRRRAYLLTQHRVNSAKIVEHNEGPPYTYE